jgi:DNA transformation protein
MPISEEYLDYVLDQLEELGAVSARKMFGGAGIYLDGIFFALIADDILYFKVDETNLQDYLSVDSNQFKPLLFYEVPADILENRDALVIWAEKAVAVAVSKLSTRKPKKKKRS